MPVEFSSPVEGRTAPRGREPNLPGDRYGRLTLVREVEGQSCWPSVRKWEVRCECGAGTRVALDHLRTGHTTSCKCYHREAAASAGRASATHGLTQHPLYNTHKAMRDRCCNPKHHQFADYGGRGIQVCERWHLVENFVQDMYSSYREGLTLERKDNSLEYSPDNCVWATRREQNRNRRSNHLVSYMGRNICLAEACEIAGLPYSRVLARINTSNWPIPKALESPDFSEPI